MNKATFTNLAIAMQKQKPYIAMIIIQFIYAGMSLFSKVAISSGMKPSVFVAYRQMFATLALAPFAFFLEREKCPLTWCTICKIFIVSSCGIALTLNLHYAGLKYASATVAMAIPNTTPAIVFLMAVCLRMERLAITKKPGMAKVLGAILGLSGAMAFTFYKGPPMYTRLSNNEVGNSFTKTYTKEEWIKGSLLLFVANLTWCIWLIMQAPILKEYSAKLRLTTFQCGFSCVTSTVYGAIRERDISSWKLGWDFNLLSVVYCGIVVTGITYWLQVWVVDKKGPVFTAVFGPLALLVTAFFSTVFFHETLHWGSLLAAGLLVGGLYSFLWGKNREAQILTQNNLDLPKDEAHLDCIVISKPVAGNGERD